MRENVLLPAIHHSERPDTPGPLLEIHALPGRLDQISTELKEWIAAGTDEPLERSLNYACANLETAYRRSLKLADIVVEDGQ